MGEIFRQDRTPPILVLDHISRRSLVRSPQILRSLILATVTCIASAATAQPMINQAVPFQNLGSSYYEQFGVDWNLRGPGFFANFGGNNVAPPFGNFDPNAGLRTGAAFQRGPFSGNFGLTLNQGSNRSNVTTTPSVTTMNGVPGSITDQTMRPFVTSVTPVVGGGFIMPTVPPRNEGVERIQSYQRGQQADLAKRLQANRDAQQKKAYADFKRGMEAEAEEDLKKARANYRRALQTATGPLRLEILKRMNQRGWLR